MAVTQSVVWKNYSSAGGTSVLDGFLKGVVTGINTTLGTADVKVLEHVSAGGTIKNVEYQQGGVYCFKTGTIGIETGIGVQTMVLVALQLYHQQLIGSHTRN